MFSKLCVVCPFEYPLFKSLTHLSVNFSCYKWYFWWTSISNFNFFPIKNIFLVKTTLTTLKSWFSPEIPWRDHCFLFVCLFVCLNNICITHLELISVYSGRYMWKYSFSKWHHLLNILSFFCYIHTHVSFFAEHLFHFSLCLSSCSFIQLSSIFLFLFQDYLGSSWYLILTESVFIT